MEAPQGKVSTAWTSQLGFSPLEYSTSNVTDCGICKRIIDYTVQLGPDQSLNLSTSILSIILLFSLVFLLFFLSSLYRISLIGSERKPVIYNIYYYYIQLTCILFLLKVISLFLPSKNDFVQIWINFLLSIQCGIFDNLPLIWGIQPNPFSRQAKIITFLLCVFTFLSYFIFLNFYYLRFEACSWCPLFISTPKIFYFYFIYDFFYLLVIIFIKVPSIAKFFNASIRSSLLYWTSYLFGIYSLENIGLGLVMFWKIDAGYCIMNLSMILYNLLYALFIYNYSINDTFELWKIYLNQEDPSNSSSLASNPKITDLLNNPSFQIISWKELIIETRIGVGGFAEVYKGQWKGTTVAIKKLFEKFSTTYISEFVKEATILSLLKHPNVILLVGVCVEEGNYSLIFEFMEGGSLFDLIHEKQQVFSQKQVLKISIQIANGMAYLHEFQPPIIHRDLKSHNILSDIHLNVKISDFGMARVKDITKTMTRLGTPQWAAPEVLASERYSEKADVYSFGVVLWEIITCKAPYEDMNPLAVGPKVAFEHLRPPIPVTCNPHLTKLLQELWLDEPGDRPNFNEILKKLKNLKNSMKKK